MNTQSNIKNLVKEKYGAIADKSKSSTSGCGCGTKSNKSAKIVDYTIMADDYTNLNGYAKEADLGLVVVYQRNLQV